jgi:aryl-alcohol dehydrogenase-like predicted oxidoreductase
MQKTRLGKTGLQVTRTAFGALPIQRLNEEDAVNLLRKAYEAGINFFDTARGYTDSEEKIGHALSDVRHNIIIATKSGATDRKTIRKDLETSLSKLKTDYIDLFQLHNPACMPDPDDMDGAYQALADAKREGLVRHIGMTNHRLDLAMKAVASGLFETIQFPLSSLSSGQDLSLVAACDMQDVGFIAMKAMSGGLITNAASSFAFLRQYGNVVPIWGMQRISELEEFIALEQDPPKLDREMLSIIDKDRLELAGSFCRGCGYCLPCPAGIPIPLAARMSFLLRRAPYQGFITAQWQEQMDRIEGCQHCGQCIRQCPYSLDTPEILTTMLADYRSFLASHSVGQ